MPGGVRDPPLVAVVANHAIARIDPVGARALSQALVHHVVCTKTYGSAVKRYIKYMASRGQPAFPATSEWLAAYIVHAVSSISVSSLKVYLAAIQYHQVLAGFPWLLHKDELVRRALRAVKRTFPSPASALKLSISLATIIRMVAKLPGFPNLQVLAHDDLVFYLASVLGTCGFLRGGEFLTYAGSKRPVLRQRDVFTAFEGGVEVLKVNVVQPKAMWWLESAVVTCFSHPACGAEVCDLVTLFKVYKLLCAERGLSTRPCSPALMMASGMAVSREFMIRRSNDLLDAASITVYNQAGVRAAVRAASWRAGGVRSALEAGVPAPMIMVLGRWRSNAWENYAMITADDLALASAKMWTQAAKIQAVQSTFRVGEPSPAAAFLADDTM
jgi:hypothetical protein